MKRLSFCIVYFCSRVAVVIIMLAACQPDRPWLQAYPDPELDALREKGVKYRIARWPRGYKPDTLFIDERGVVDNREYIEHKRTSYDSLNFIRRRFSTLENPYYFIFRYHSLDAHHLLRESIEIDARDWDIDEKIVKESNRDTTLLEFDNLGRLIWEIDSTYLHFVKFNYDAASRLQTQTVQSLQEESSWGVRHTYSYDGNGDLEKVVKQYRFEPIILTYYYSHGLLDSLSNSEDGTICHYQHIFY